MVIDHRMNMKMEWPVEEAQQDTVAGEESRNFVIMDQDQVGLRDVRG